MNVASSSQAFTFSIRRQKRYTNLFTCHHKYISKSKTCSLSRTLFSEIYGYGGNCECEDLFTLNADARSAKSADTKSETQNIGKLNGNRKYKSNKRIKTSGVHIFGKHGYSDTIAFGVHVKSEFNNEEREKEATKYGTSVY